MTDYINRIFNEDSFTGLDMIPDGSIDLVVMDPPYEMDSAGGGAFGSANRLYHSELEDIRHGIANEFLDKLVPKMKAINLYVWCNKNQLRQYINYFGDRGCLFDLLAWHKTNPVPTCSNKYLSDTEYCCFFRDKGVRVNGTYDTKRKWYVTPLNVEDKEKYGHPTIKPLPIIRNLVLNSMPTGGGIVMDPFAGSGTTLVAAKELGCDYVGFEINPEYYDIALRRVSSVSVGQQPHTSQKTLDVMI